MGATRSAEEIYDDHIARMGSKLGTVYYALWNECGWLHSKWYEYRQLFGTSPERIDLLNQAAGLFFMMVQDVFWDELLLHVARLTDSPLTSNKANLTIRALPDLIDDPDLASKLNDAIAVAVTRTEFARDWRNRRIAHTDLQLRTQSEAKPLRPASRNDVDGALSGIAEVLNILNQHYLDSTVFYEGLGSIGGAEALLYVIRDGVQAKQARFDRLRRGEPLPEDMARKEAL